MVENYNVEIEKELIRNLFINPEYLKILDNESKEFSDVGCRLIYEKMKILDKENKPIDLYTVAEGFKEEGFFQFTKDLFVNTTLPASIRQIEEYAEIIKKNSVKEKIKSKAKLLQDLDDFDKLVKTCNEMPEVANYSSNNDEKDAYDGAMEFYKRINSKKEYIRTGFSKIDKKSFITKGDYIVVGARPSTGKTAFSLQMLSQISDKYKTVFFSLETSHGKIYDRLMSNVSSIQMNKIKTSDFDEYDKEKIIEGIDKLGKKKITVVEAGGYTVEKIKAKAIKLKAEVIFIDYLGLIKSDGKSRYEKITNISVDLHTLAQECGITVVALSQLRRNDDKLPTMEDLRESGQIEQDADMIILLHDNEQTNTFDTIIAKNKEGETGIVKMKFYKNTQCFYEI